MKSALVATVLFVFVAAFWFLLTPAPKRSALSCADSERTFYAHLTSAISAQLDPNATFGPYERAQITCEDSNHFFFEFQGTALGSARTFKGDARTLPQGRIGDIHWYGQ